MYGVCARVRVRACARVRARARARAHPVHGTLHAICTHCSSLQSIRTVLPIGCTGRLEGCEKGSQKFEAEGICARRCQRRRHIDGGPSQLGTKTLVDVIHSEVRMYVRAPDRDRARCIACKRRCDTCIQMGNLVCSNCLGDCLHKCVSDATGPGGHDRPPPLRCIHLP